MTTPPAPPFTDTRCNVEVSFDKEAFPTLGAFTRLRLDLATWLQRRGLADEEQSTAYHESGSKAYIVGYGPFPSHVEAFRLPAPLAHLLRARYERTSFSIVVYPTPPDPKDDALRSPYSPEP